MLIIAARFVEGIKIKRRSEMTSFCVWLS